MSTGEKIAALSTGISVLLAGLGCLFAWWHGRSTARHEAQLARVNRQLRELYGPLHATLKAEEAAWKSFRGTVRPDGAFWAPKSPPSASEAASWRLWMRVVFTPLNERVHELIVGNADLIVDDEMPDCFLQLSAHVVGYRTVLQRWSEKDFAEHCSVCNYPSRELLKHVDLRYRELKAKQAGLLGATK